MTAAADDSRLPLREKELTTRLITAAYQTDDHLTQEQVDALLGIGANVDAT